MHPGKTRSLNAALKGAHHRGAARHTYQKALCQLAEGPLEAESYQGKRLEELC